MIGHFRSHLENLIIGHTSFECVATIKFSQVIQHVVGRYLSTGVDHGRKIFEEYKKTFKILDDQNFNQFRIYSRLLKRAGFTRTDSFMTFKPRFEHNYWHQSPILEKLIQKDNGQMGYGLALYDGISKIWIAPYGNQLEFMQTLSTNYEPFIDIPGNPGIPHYIGFFPDLHYHQVYYYLGTNTQRVDSRLAHLNPDYFAFSRTYDRDWNLLKENSYAIRVPFSNYKNTESFELPCVPYLNVSYRRLLDGEEESVSYLCWKLREDQMKDFNK